MNKLAAISIATLQTLTAVSASAAQGTQPARPNTLRCMVLLQEPTPDDGSLGLQLAPAQNPPVFDYVVNSELTIKLATKLISAPPVNDPHPWSMYSLVRAKSDAETTLTIQFSQKGPDGEKIHGPGYGFYMYSPAEGQRRGAWSLGSDDGAFGSTNIQITDKIMGYMILSCVQR